MESTVSHYSASPRVEWVDKAKGICIILVVMLHTTLGLEKSVGETGWMHYLVEFSKPFRMPDFFMISGLFLAATIDRPWRLYLDRKVVHFFYFYILWVVIQFSFKAPFMVQDGASVDAVVRSLLFSVVQPFGTLWFIYMLPVFFVVTKLFRSKPWWLLGAAAVLQILPINTSEIYPAIVQPLGLVSVDSHFVLIDEFCSFFVYFLVGYLFAEHIFRLSRWACDHADKALLALAGWFVINLTFVAQGWSGLPLISLWLGCFGAVAIVIGASLLTKIGGTSGLSYLGSNSIVIYLAFFLPMIISRLAFTKFLPGMDVGTMAALSTMIAVVTPAIGYMIIKRIGFGLFLFHRPAWAITAHKPGETKAALQAAE